MDKKKVAVVGHDADIERIMSMRRDLPDLGKIEDNPLPLYYQHPIHPKQSGRIYVCNICRKPFGKGRLPMVKNGYGYAHRDCKERR